jgi:hypothetical protein
MEHKLPSGKRAILLLFCLAVAAAIAWSGLLENYSEDYVNRAFAGAGLIYATARGINGLVSVLQGTELDVVFVTVAIGEALDPINDLIERFSDFILVALGSLALQKILLGLVSHTLFNILLTALAASVAYTLLRRDPTLYRPLFQAFLVTAFLRFSLGLVVLANNWVDSTFLQEQDQQRHAAMESFQGELREASALAGANGSLETQIEESRQQLNRLESRRMRNTQSLDEVRRELALAETRLSTLISADGLGCTAITVSRHTCSEPVLQAAKLRDQLAQTADALELEAEKIAAAAAEQEDARACLQKRSRGESCGLLDSVRRTVSPQQLRDKINELENGMNAFAENTIDLLVSLLLKSIAIPLGFFYLLLKLLRMNWSRFS